MRRRIVMVIAVATAAIGAAFSGAAPNAPAAAGSTSALPKLPPYIDQLGVGLALHSNASWHEKSSRRPARQIRRQADIWGGDDKPFFIWTRSCRTRRQVAVFSRRVFLPGPPSPEQSGLTMKPVLMLDGAERWDVRFNGSSVYRGQTRPATPIPLGRTQLRKLHRGANTIEVTATKPATACSSFGGIYFGFGAQFTADLYVDQSGSDVRYDELRTGAGAVIPGRLTMGNKGPTEAAYATFHLDVVHASSYGEWDFFPEGQGAVKNCKKTEDSSNFRVRCEWIGFPPTATGALAFILRFTVTKTPWPDADIVMSYYITADSDPYRGPKDPVYGNNARQLRLVLCGPLSTREGCRNLLG